MIFVSAKRPVISLWNLNVSFYHFVWEIMAYFSFSHKLKYAGDRLQKMKSN